MNGHMSGTSLKELQSREHQDINKLQQMQLLQQQYRNSVNNSISSQDAYAKSGAVRQIMRTDQADIEDLARDIGDTMPVDKASHTAPSVIANVKDEHNDEDIEPTKKSNKGGLLASVPAILREPLILVVLYVILSQAPVKNFIGTYVKQINVDDSGAVSFVGVVIYGIILATLFVLAKKLLLK